MQDSLIQNSTLKKYKWLAICIISIIVSLIIITFLFLYFVKNASNDEIGEKFTDFEIEVLNKHNEYREKHGVNPLKLNKEICKVAQRWADILAVKGRIQHNYNEQYGDNIFWITGKKLSGSYCVKSWYDEIYYYDFKNPRFSSDTAHFTQLVWKNSSELGVGYAQKDNQIYIVANYYPPGNYPPELYPPESFVKNVPPPFR